MREAARVAVVGGGIFGCTIAVDLARAGFEVDLFERHPQLLRGATAANLYRAHRGYHYPRDRATALATKHAEAGFRERFAAAMVVDQPHWYAIARDGSRTDAKAFEAFCTDLGLEYSPEMPSIVRSEAVEACYRVREARYVPDALRQVCERELASVGVNVHLSETATPSSLDGYDLRILANYVRLGDWEGLGAVPHQRQFEVCEVPVVQLPEPFSQRSIVVIDGAFMGFDPIDAERHALYHVEHSVLHRSIGVHPELPDELTPLLDQGVVTAPRGISRFEAMRDHGQALFNGFEPTYLGSMFVLRVVLTNVDATDARPTLVDRIDERTISVFSGKVVTAVDASRSIVEIAAGLRNG